MLLEAFNSSFQSFKLKLATSLILLGRYFSTFYARELTIIIILGARDRNKIQLNWKENKEGFVTTTQYRTYLAYYLFTPRHNVHLH